MKIALARMNPTIGDLEGNAAMIVAMSQDAAVAGCDLVVFPELALTGYPPKDLLLRRDFMDAVLLVIRDLMRAVPANITVVYGTPTRGMGAALHNGLIALRDGEQHAQYAKRLLPNYDVFDESRYFVPGTQPCVIGVPVAGQRAVRVGLSICEDLWGGHDTDTASRYEGQDPIKELVAASADVIVNASASPFALGKREAQLDIMHRLVRRYLLPVVAINQCGGNDGLVFDGVATAAGPSPRGQHPLHGWSRPFDSGVVIYDMASGGLEPPTPIADCQEEIVFRALVLGVRDYCRKTGHTSVVLGLSGGIDSAVVACIAAAALGYENVRGIAMPSRYSSEGSLTDAAKLYGYLGIARGGRAEVPCTQIDGILDAFSETRRFEGVAAENIQSRIRGAILMAESNQTRGALVLCTGNKSELAVGYCTLYGDLIGALAPLGDVYKGQVYALARWINSTHLAGAVIPQASIDKPPSAELRPGQTDQDTLPPYPVLDEIIRRYVELGESPQAIKDVVVSDDGESVTKAFEPATVDLVVAMVDRAEHKRHQAPPCIKISSTAFGAGRRMPIANGWKP